MSINRHAGTNFVLAGESRQPMSLDGRLYAKTGLALTTSGTIEEVLLTLPIPRNTLNTNGKSLRVTVYAFGTGGNKVIGMHVGSLTGSSIFSTAAWVSATGIANVLIIREAKTIYDVFGFLALHGTSPLITRTTLADDLSDGFNLVITGTTNGAAGALTISAVMVDLITEGGL